MTEVVKVQPDRACHWIQPNHQTRMPKRWVAFDTEAKSSYDGDIETQTWQMGAAIRWRTDLKTGDHAQAETFNSAMELWQWVSDFCRTGTRTVVVAHNLGYDVRTSDALGILPQFGFTLEWCNLDSNVSAMTWRSDHGSLVLCDLWTWLPMQLNAIGLSIGLRKLTKPPDTAKHARWEKYCMRDAEIVYRAYSEILAYIKMQELGNWQPTGAGMAYAAWRHKYLDHKVLVHDDVDALEAERIAMHTGRAEAWRHGVVDEGVYTEVDMRNAYVTIARDYDLPIKLKMKTGAITHDQYSKLGSMYARLCCVRVVTDQPVVPCKTDTATVWPVGEFTTWLWDAEVDALIRSGQRVAILATICYTKGPVLRRWADWIHSLLGMDAESVSPVVRTWGKHCGRALIGRISLRTSSWEYHSANPCRWTGISYETDPSTGATTRMMHVGDRTFTESAKTEGRDSLPQITGYVMSVCRAQLWAAMCAAGTSDVAHVDTDSLLVSRAGLGKLRDALGPAYAGLWAVKGSWRRLIIYGPRNYRVGAQRKTSGVPRKAKEILPNVFIGERWHGVAYDLEKGHHDAVTIEKTRYEVKTRDPRRLDDPANPGRTVPIKV